MSHVVLTCGTHPPRERLALSYVDNIPFNEIRIEWLHSGQKDVTENENGKRRIKGLFIEARRTLSAQPTQLTSTFQSQLCIHRVLYLQRQIHSTSLIPNEHPCEDEFGWINRVAKGAVDDFSWNFLRWKISPTRLTASSQAFLSSVTLALLTLMTSRSSAAMMMLKGPVGLSGDGGLVGLNDLALWPFSTFFERAIDVGRRGRKKQQRCQRRTPRGANHVSHEPSHRSLGWWNFRAFFCFSSFSTLSRSTRYFDRTNQSRRMDL